MIKLKLSDKPADKRIEATGSIIISIYGVKQRRTSYRLQGLRSDVHYSLREFISQVANRVVENYNGNPNNESVGSLEDAMRDGYVNIETIEDIPETLNDTMQLTISGQSGDKVNISSLSVDYAAAALGNKVSVSSNDYPEQYWSAELSKGEVPEI